MSLTGDSSKTEHDSGGTLPDRDDLTGSVRGEIAEFFGAKPAATAEPRRDPGGFGRLLADLEDRILAGIRQAEAPPAELGPFYLEEAIGRGGFAVVYRATHKRTGARAAVKLVPAADADSHQRIKTEVESLIQLRHPNIIRVIDTGEDAGFAWVATDYIDGMTLADFIRSSRTMPDSFHIGDDAETPAAARRPAQKRDLDAAAIKLAVSWFRDLAGALDALHQIGLVHRDVKPANILIDSKQRPYLIDFGLSSSAESTVNGILAGTVPYMSPEQTLGGYVAITPRSDVYSLTATFHEVLTGLRVTHGARRDAILHEIAFVQVPPPSLLAPSVPAALDPIFLKALAKDSNRRYASAKELEEDLDHYLRGLTLVHVKEPFRRRFGRSIRRHPIGIAIGALVLTLLLGWGITTRMADAREYRETLTGIEGSLHAGKPLDALSSLAAKLPKYGDRQEFRELHKQAVYAGGEPLLLDLLRKLTFAAANLAPLAAHTRIGDQAKAHLSATGIPDASLVLVVLISQLFSASPGDNVDDATATVARHRALVDGDRLLTEFEAVLALHRKDRPAYLKIAERVAAFPPSPNRLMDACFRAWRLLTCRQRYPDIVIPPAEMTDLTEELTRCLKGTDHAFARATLTLLAVDRSDYHDALVQVRELSRVHGGVADKTGTMIVEAAIHMTLAGQSSGADRDTYWKTGSNLAKAGLEIDPRYGRRLYYDLRNAALAIRLQWIETVLDDHWPKRPPFDRYLLNFVAKAARDLAARNDVVKIASLAQAAESQPSFARSVGDPDNLRFEMLHLWALRMRRLSLANQNVREARALAVRAREVVALWKRASTDIPYALGVEDGVAEGFVARTETEPANRRKLISEALEHLRKLDQDAVLTDAQRVVPEQERESLAELRRLCAYEIGLLVAQLESDEPDSQPDSR